MLVHLPRLLSAILTAALLAAPLPAQAFAPSAAEIERLYNEGDKRNSEGDFKGAAESWTRLLVLLPEEGANQATRENLLLNILDAHINAYNRVVGSDGKKDASHLQEGKRTFELYLTQYRAVYGSGRAISAAVQQKGDELDAALQKADAEGKVVTDPVNEPPDPKVDPDDKNKTKIDPGPPVLPPENNGIGLIVGGSVTAALGLGALGVLIAGAVGAPKAEHEYEVAQADLVVLCPGYPMACQTTDPAEQNRIKELQGKLDDADKHGRVANALTITGAVLTPVLLGAGAAMLAIGIKRHRAANSARSSVSAAPGIAPGFAGVVLSGRF
jgi:hypothetical protein